VPVDLQVTVRSRSRETLSTWVDHDLQEV